jgi:aspartate carbamoyltransferase catalytic subunit
LNNLSVAFVGDLLNSRPLHSLMPLLIMHPGNKYYFVSPKELELPRQYINELKKKKVFFEEVRGLEEILPKVDVLYMTRVQKERFSKVADYEKVKNVYILKKEHLKKMKKKAVIMHALPRVNEIESAIDQDLRAAYFRQAQNGLYVRMALLCYSLGM